MPSPLRKSQRGNPKGNIFLSRWRKSWEGSAAAHPGQELSLAQGSAEFASASAWRELSELGIFVFLYGGERKREVFSIWETEISPLFPKGKGGEKIC